MTQPRSARRPPARAPTTPAPAPPAWLDGAPGLVVVLGVAFAVRLLHVLEASRLPIFERPSVDAALYVDQARRLALTWVEPEVFFKPPLYPYLLAVWWRVVGDSWLWLRLPGVLLGTASCGLVWCIGRRLFGARVAVLGALLLALHRTAVHFDGELLEIGLVTGVQLAALLLVLRTPAAARPRPAALAAGLALGLGAVARPTFLLFVLAAVVWMDRRQARVALLGAALAVAPVTLHNAVRGHDFVLVSANLGLNYYLGNNPRADGRIAAAAELPANPEAARRAAIALAERAAGEPLRPSQVSSYWLQRGLEFDRAHPGRAAALLGRKLFYAWNAAEISDNEDLAGLARHLRLFAGLPVGMWLLAPLGLVGLWAAPRRRDVNLARLYVGTQIAALLPFFVVARFRLPWVPVLALFAAWTLAELGRRGRRRAGLGPLALGTAAALLACNLPLFGVRAPVDFDLEYKLAWAWQQRGDLERAQAGYERAVELHPESALARNALGVLLAERGGDLERAAALVESALRLDPGRAASYYESLAGVHLRRGDPQAAAGACAAGLASAPEAATRAALLLRQGEVARRLGDPRGEAAALRAALELGLEPGRRAAAQARLAEVETSATPPPP